MGVVSLARVGIPLKLFYVARVYYIEAQMPFRNLRGTKKDCRAGSQDGSPRAAHFHFNFWGRGREMFQERKKMKKHILSWVSLGALLLSFSLVTADCVAAQDEQDDPPSRVARLSV